MTVQRLFCMSGVATYGTDRENLTRVPEELRTVRKALSGLGLDELFPFDKDERDHQQLHDELLLWSTKDPEPTDDAADTTLVIYCTGHGLADGGRFRLARAGGLRFDPTELVAAVERRRDLRQIVLIIDACFAEQGVDDVVAEARVPGSRTANMDVWSFGAARRADEAQQGAFAHAFADALVRAAHPSWDHEYLDLASVELDVERQLADQPQRTWNVQANQRPCRALPNPLHQPKTLPQTLSSPLPSHWIALARGVHSANRPGWFFTGRTGVLRDVVKHLAGAGPERILVVTGGPGSGKSALLGYLALIGTSSSRITLPTVARARHLVGEDAVTAAGRFDPMDQDGVTRTLAHGLGAAGSTADIVRAAQERCGLTGIVLDQLDDEAPDWLWTELVGPLAAIPGVRLVLGSSRAVLGKVPGPIRLVDLDSDVDGAGDVLNYLTLRVRLARQGLGLHEVVRTAAALAGQACDRFDVASAAADALQGAIRCGVSSSKAEAAAETAAAETARTLCLRIARLHLGDRVTAAVDALSVLCSHHESVALSAVEWATVASDPPGIAVSPDEMVATAFALKSFLEQRHSPDGTLRWRPRFRPLPTQDTSEAERLLLRLPQLNSGATGDWSSVDVAVWPLLVAAAHLETPAGKLIDLPEFLLASPASRVMAAMRKIGNKPEQARRARMWRTVPCEAPPGDRALLLGIGARRYGVPTLAGAPASIGYRPSLGIRWVHPDPSRDKQCTHLATAAPGPASAALTAHEDRTFAIWDPKDGTCLTGPQALPGAPYSVSVTVGKTGVLALLSTRQREVWVIRQSEVAALRSVVPDNAAGGPTLVALHATGLAVTTSGTQAWLLDVEAGELPRQLARMDSTIWQVLLVGTVQAPVAWLVSDTGRIRRVPLRGPARPSPASFPVPHGPLQVAADATGDRLLVVDRSGTVHLRGAGAAATPLMGLHREDVRAAAVNGRWAAVAGVTPGRAAWLDIYDITDLTGHRRIPLDDTPVGVDFVGDDELIVARSCGLMVVDIGETDLPANLRCR